MTLADIAAIRKLRDNGGSFVQEDGDVWTFNGALGVFEAVSPLDLEPLIFTSRDLDDLVEDL